MSQPSTPPPPPPLSPPPLSQAPQQLGYATPVGRTDLRTVAMYQRAIQYCVLGYILAAVSQLFLPFPVNIIMALVVLAAAVTGAVFVFMLAIAIYSTGVGILLGILTLIPLLGLIVLLIVNGKATNILRDHGLKVGLMGAKLNQIPAAGQVPLQ